MSNKYTCETDIKLPNITSIDLLINQSVHAKHVKKNEERRMQPFALHELKYYIFIYFLNTCMYVCMHACMYLFILAAVP